MSDAIQVSVSISQLLVSIGVGAVAWRQAKAADKQAEAAQAQSEVAREQARVAETSLRESLRPRLVPLAWQVDQNGVKITVQNTGPGRAYALRWRVDKEWTWTDLDDILPPSENVIVTPHQLPPNRSLVIEYSSQNGDTYTSKFEPDLHIEHSDSASDELIKKIRSEQRRS